jgi:hypothetical protein
MRTPEALELFEKMLELFRFDVQADLHLTAYGATQNPEELLSYTECTRLADAAALRVGTLLALEAEHRLENENGAL